LDVQSSRLVAVCACIREQKKSRKSQLDAWLEESSSDDEFVESDTEEERHHADQHTESDHWLIQKLFRYIKVSLFLSSSASNFQLN